MKRTFGTLIFDKFKKTWVFSGLQPHVIIKLKHLFPSVPKNAKEIEFAHKLDTIMDLSWFIIRYPMRMKKSHRKYLKYSEEKFQKRIEKLEALLAPNYEPTGPLEVGNITLRNYQIQFVKMGWAVKRMVLGDETGIGKTFQSLALGSNKKCLPILCVVQTHLPEQWKENIDIIFPNCKYHYINSTKPYTLPPADIYVTKYSIIGYWFDYWHISGIKTVIFDEIQELRHAGTQKYLSAQKLSHDVCEYAIGLSATPIFNYGDETFTIFDLIKKGCLGEREDFNREWLDFSNRTVKDPQALGAYLREQHLFLRRDREMVGRELPPVNTITQYIETDAKELEKVEDLARALAMKSLRGPVLEMGQSRRELDIMMRHATGVAKAKGAAQYARMFLENGEKVCLVGWHRDCFIAGTKIMMFDGTSKIVEEVVAGDQVMGPDSSPRTVKSIITGHGKMFKIIPSKGDSWICSENHILTVKRNNRRKFTIEHIKASEFFYKSERQKRNYSIFRSGSITFDNPSKVVEPWLIGFWLGDGASRLSDLRVSSADVEVENTLIEIASRNNLTLRKWKSLGATGLSNCHQYCLTTGTGIRTKIKNELLEYFRSLGLDRNKHIPATLKTSSIEDRIQILAGLLDSDGHVYRNGCGADFSTISYTLAKDVEWLCRSLGLAAYIKIAKVSKSGYGHNGRTYIRVSISGDLTNIPTVIQRKKSDIRKINKNVLNVGFKIEEYEESNFYGFETDGDNLFLLNDFTVVHNCYDIWLRELKEFNPQMYTGSEGEKAKRDSLAKFKSSESNLFILSLRSGAGIDGLQEYCSTVLFGELDWSPQIHKQIIDRFNRDRKDGKKNNVTAVFLLSNDGSDPVIVDMLGLKSSQAKGIVDPFKTQTTVTHSDETRLERLAKQILAKKGINA